MRITRDELVALLRLVELTEPREIDCEEFVARVAGYVERLGDAPAPPGARALLHHLEVCPECREELEALLRALGRE